MKQEKLKRGTKYADRQRAEHRTNRVLTLKAVRNGEAILDVEKNGKPAGKTRIMADRLLSLSDYRKLD